ncbi:MAG TPA: AI-2E family transporter [Stellaceae bacterium]|nr:AI-2E family transporter [Stellaceae bacterium]
MSPRGYRLLFWLGLILIAIIALGMVQSILLPFAAGVVLAFVLSPAVNRLERWGVRRSLAALAVLTLFLIGVVLVFVILVPLIQNQVVQLIGKVPALVAFLKEQNKWVMGLLEQRLPKDQMDKLQDLINSKLGEAVAWIATLLQSLITSSIAILNIVSLVVIAPIVTFFLMRDWEAIVAVLDDLVPRQSLATVRAQARAVSDTLVGFIHGQALVCLSLAVYYGAALSLAQLDSGLALGFLIGVLAVIPMLGATLGFVLALGLAATQYGTWTSILTVIAIFAIGQVIEGNFLTPKLVGDRIRLHPVWVIFALFAGATLFGFVGVLFAVPAAAVIGVLVRFAVSRYRHSAIYDSRPGAPRGLAPDE